MTDTESPCETHPPTRLRGPSGPAAAPRNARTGLTHSLRLRYVAFAANQHALGASPHVTSTTTRPANRVDALHDRQLIHRDADVPIIRAPDAEHVIASGICDTGAAGVGLYWPTGRRRPSAPVAVEPQDPAVGSAIAHSASSGSRAR